MIFIKNIFLYLRNNSFPIQLNMVSMFLLFLLKKINVGKLLMKLFSLFGDTLDTLKSNKLKKELLFLDSVLLLLF